MGEKCFVYFGLPLRMFCSLPQNTDNQNVFRGGEREERERKIEQIWPTCSVEVPCRLVRVAKRAHAVFKKQYVLR